jgi:predicted DNA-binding transcriptional regulator YafY
MDRVRRERAWGLVEEQSGPEGIDVTLLDYSLEWLACWILSFGSLAEALEPERLRELVAADAHKVAAKYAPAPSADSSLTTRPPTRKSPRSQPALA